MVQTIMTLNCKKVTVTPYGSVPKEVCIEFRGEKDFDTLVLIIYGRSWDEIKEIAHKEFLKEREGINFCSQCGEEFAESYSHCEDHTSPRTITKEERIADDLAREADRLT